MKITKLQVTTPIDNANEDISKIEIVLECENRQLVPFNLTPGSPYWKEVLELVNKKYAKEISNEELAAELHELLMISSRIAKKFNSISALTNRMEIKENHVFVDGSRLEPVLERQVVRLSQEKVNTDEDKRNWEAFLNFVSNLLENTSMLVQEQLYKWLLYELQSTGRLTLTTDGCFIGYKGLRRQSDGTLASVHSGVAFVNGVLYDGCIPNAKGDIITMPRAKVMDDPRVGCSYGLHVGSLNYAKSWAPELVAVKVNPADVVSVPDECSCQKIRTCKYEVLGEVTGALDGLSIDVCSIEPIAEDLNHFNSDEDYEGEWGWDADEEYDEDEDLEDEDCDCPSCTKDEDEDEDEDCAEVGAYDYDEGCRKDGTYNYDEGCNCMNCTKNDCDGCDCDCNEDDFEDDCDVGKLENCYCKKGFSRTAEDTAPPKCKYANAVCQELCGNYTENCIISAKNSKDLAKKFIKLVTDEQKPFELPLKFLKPDTTVCDTVLYWAWDTINSSSDVYGLTDSNTKIYPAKPVIERAPQTADWQQDILNAIGYVQRTKKPQALLLTSSQRHWAYTHCSNLAKLKAVNMAGGRMLVITY